MKVDVFYVYVVRVKWVNIRFIGLFLVYKFDFQFKSIVGEFNEVVFVNVQ